MPRRAVRLLALSLDVADADDIGSRILRGSARESAENGANASGELASVEWLRQVIVGADLQADDAVNLVATRGEQQNGDIVAGLAQPTQQFKAGELGEHYVQDDDGEGFGGDQGEAGFGIVRAGDAEALSFEKLHDELAQLHVIVDDQYPVHIGRALESAALSILQPVRFNGQQHGRLHYRAMDSRTWARARKTAVLVEDKERPVISAMSFRLFSSRKRSSKTCR